MPEEVRLHRALLNGFCLYWDLSHRFRDCRLEQCFSDAPGTLCVWSAEWGAIVRFLGPLPLGPLSQRLLEPPSQQSRQLKTHSRLKTTSLAIAKRLEDEQLPLIRKHFNAVLLHQPEFSPAFKASVLVAEGRRKTGVFPTQASDLLRKMCTRNLVRKYCRGITAERRALVGTRRVGRWQDRRGVGASPSRASGPHPPSRL